MSIQFENRPNILYIAKNIPVPTRKANRVIFTLAEKLTSRYDIDFLYPKERVPFFAKNLQKYRHLSDLKPWQYSRFTVNIIEYLRLPLPDTAFLLTRFFLNRSGIGEKYRFIHAHYVLPDGYLAGLIGENHHIPFGVTVRKTDIELLSRIKNHSHTRRIIRKVLEGASFVTCLNASVRDRVQDEFGVKAFIIPHGIDESWILDQAPDYDSVLNISCVGDFIRTKHMDWVIRAFQELKSDKRLSLTLIGDGPCEEELKKLAKGREDIIFTGRIPKTEVMDRLTRSRIFLLPSSSETYGLVYNEAAARHNAIIGFKGQGPCGTFEADREMLFAENYEDFAQKMRALVMDPGQIKTLADNALEKARQITWTKISEKYHALYSGNR